MSDQQAETLAERDARIHAWLEDVKPGDIVTVRLNSTDILSGKVYEAPDARGTSLCVWTTVLRHGNGYPGGSFEPMTEGDAQQVSPNAPVGKGLLRPDERDRVCICPWDGPVVPESTHVFRCSQHRELIERLIEEREAKARYFAFWHYFLRLPGPTPFSDMVQTEAMRLRTLVPSWSGRVHRPDKPLGGEDS